MAEKVVAAIMNRVYLEDDNFIFYMSHPTIGEIDDKTKILKDRNGREYVSMVDPSLLMSEVSTAYYYPIPLRKIKDAMGLDSTKEAIAEYEYNCGSSIYYVSNNEETGVFCVPINLNSIKENVKYAVDEYSKMSDVIQKDDEENDEENTEQYNIGDLKEQLSYIIEEMIKGSYSLEELKAMRDRARSEREELGYFLDSLMLQIEASEKGESATILKGEEKKKVIEEPVRVTKTDTSSDVKIKNHIDLEGLYKKITKSLIAQDEPARRVITEIARKEQSRDSKNRAILITGQSGSGKTMLMQLIAKYLDRPFIKVDSTQLTIPGYVGKDIEEVLWDLYVSCGKDKDKAEHAIIFFDEIDKKGSSRKDDVSGKGVLNVLLPFIEGATYDATESVRFKNEIVKIDTSNMIVILGGAFTDVYKDLMSKNGIGFGADVNGKAPKQANTEDFVEKAKMPDEFMGRVSVVKLNDLDLEAIKRILTESDESALRIQEKLFKELGVKLTPSEGYINAVCEEANKRKTGARGLNTVVDETTWEAYGDAYSHLGQYDEIILEEETLHNPKQYKKVLRKGDNN